MSHNPVRISENRLPLSFPEKERRGEVGQQSNPPLIAIKIPANEEKPTKDKRTKKVQTAEAEHKQKNKAVFWVLGKLGP